MNLRYKYNRNAGKSDMRGVARRGTVDLTLPTATAHLLLLVLPPFLLPIFGFHPFAFLHVSLLDSRVPEVDTFFGCPGGAMRGWCQYG